MRYIAGIFTDKQDAKEVVQKLREKGYGEDISVIARDEKDSQVTSGVMTGGAVGGIVGLLAGLSSVAIPGVGSLLVAGPFMAAWGITGAALGALAGGLVGGLVDLGMTEESARRYQDRIIQGDVMVAVSLEEKMDSAKKQNATGKTEKTGKGSSADLQKKSAEIEEIMTQHNAEEINISREK
ncbi:MAG: low temperature-induced protein [Patescibacteria group bacterium]